jgi:hypothetical protein
MTKSDVQVFTQDLQRFFDKTSSIQSRDEEGLRNRDKYIAVLKDALTRLNAEKTRLANENAELKKIVSCLISEREHKKNVSPFTQQKIDERILSAFNAWAANPFAPLPSSFVFVSNEMHIRTSVTMTASANAAKWIADKGKQYLFPNPNFFDDRTDISELYKMDMTQLKQKGCNKIKVIMPCAMTDSGYINYPGELQFLSTR